LTAFDWNDADPNIIGTASIDTTCTIWDLSTGQAKTQLIAHDKEVYDIAFASRSVFGSVGAEGSVRLFDLRSLEHSTIIYETGQGTDSQKPLLRLAWNKSDPNFIATVPLDSDEVIVLDIRVPTVPVALLSAHDASINSISWAPHSECHICSAADDSMALIWDLMALPKSIDEPILVYNAPAPVNQLQWSKAHTDWVAIAYADSMQLLRV